MSPQSILFLSHSNVFEHFKVGSHHYATELALRGHDVFHVSTPISVAHRVLRRVGSGSDDARRRGWITDESGVHHLVPSTVLPAGLLVGTTTRALAALPRQRFDVTFLDQPLMWSPAVRALSETLVYRPTDTYDEGRKRRLQQAALAQADGVVATSDEVLRRLQVPSGLPRLVLPNGVDVRNFSAPPGERGDVAVYVGALDSRFAWDDVRTLAERFPSWRFEIHGPSGSEPSGLPANIRMMGPIDYTRLGTVFASSRIGLLPLSDAPVNAGRSPMKLYEYLAGGLSVLATSTPTIAEKSDAGLLTYATRDDMVEKFALLTTAAPNRTGESVANKHSWHRKADELLSFTGHLGAS